MENKCLIEFYARAYNTIQEIERTREDQCDYWTDKRIDFPYLWLILDTINDWAKKEFTEEEYKEFIRLTDNIKDRIYFNCWQ